MQKRNIYQNQSQELLHLFEEAGSSDKVMCVPMDYAKKDHLAMFCNGYGDILRKPFSVKNTPEGIAYTWHAIPIGYPYRSIMPDRREAASYTSVLSIIPHP